MYHNPDYYCNRKFSTWEIRESEFEEALNFCLYHYDKNNTLNGNAISTAIQETLPSKKKVIILVSYREPISRTLSLINQNCNHRLKRKSQIVQDACLRCSYYDDIDYWDSQVQDTNRAMEGIRTLARRKDISSGLGPPLFLIDMLSLTSFFEELEELSNTTIPLGKPNSEKPHKHCDFGMTSAMIRGLASASNIYLSYSRGTV